MEVNQTQLGEMSVSGSICRREREKKKNAGEGEDRRKGDEKNKEKKRKDVGEASSDSLLFLPLLIEGGSTSVFCTRGCILKKRLCEREREGTGGVRTPELAVASTGLFFLRTIHRRRS